MVDLTRIKVNNLLNNISSGIMIVSLDNKIKFINKAGEKILNIKDKYIDKNLDDIINNNILKLSIKKTIEYKKPLARIVANLKINDKIVIIGFTTSIYFDDDNNLKGVIINFRNITDKILLEKKLKYSETKYKLLIQNLQCPIFIINFNNYKIIECNQIAENILGFTKNELIKLNLLNLIISEDREKAKKYLLALKNNSTKENKIEVQLLNREKKFRIFDLMANIFSIGKQNYIQVICVETTEKVLLTNDLKKSYNQLKETQEIIIRAERLAAVGELAAGISHEIKNRFQVISNALTYIKNKIDLSNETIKINIEYIEKEINRGTKLINDLMEFSRPHPPSKSFINLNNIITDSLPLLKKQFDTKNIQIITELNDIPKTYVDYNLIQQVIINVLKNAEYAMSNNGKLTIKTYTKKKDEIEEHLIIKREKKFDLYNVIEIADTGIGIEEKYLCKVFTPFFSTKGPNEGSGLGLSVSNKIIENHNGFMDIESKLNFGTTVFIYLPVIKKLNN
ncbi:MAG TPA: ATP-binding protein [bacterium]|nr:ATP-binding protein [bacterium]HOL48553.1 ATP-binding protein [bacterium]HPQ18020.1 ATP-binding protein [bacterium]